MARRKRESKTPKRPTNATPRNQIPTLAEILAGREFHLETMDVALLNLLCAAGLLGAEHLEITRLLTVLDDWADLAKYETERNYYKFMESPGTFNNSQAYFCILCMVTVLQTRCGVRYNPRWIGVTPGKPIPKEFGRDARDLFIHAIIDGPGGTCGSLPVLYAAVGRRLGYPLKIVKACRHLFLRWDDADAKHWFCADRFNIEATGPGIHCLPDDQYRAWPHPIPSEDIEAGVFLKSLSPAEELAEFIAARAHCMASHGALPVAIRTMRQAVQLAPHNRHHWASCDAWGARRKLLARRHSFLSNPKESPDLPPSGPRWMETPDGKRVLVQVLRSGVRPPLLGLHDIGRPLIRTLIELPDGQYLEADLPTHGSGEPMEASWLRLPSGEYALVHSPRGWQSRTAGDHVNGHPILPHQASASSPRLAPSLPAPARNALEHANLIAQIQRQNTPQPAAGLQAASNLALPMGPSRPRLEPPGLPPIK